MTIVEALTDLKAVADGLRDTDSETAQKIDDDRNTILRSLPPLTSDEAAEQLKTTRPTVHSWVDLEVLDRHPDSSEHKLLITAESVASILPAVLRWESEGRTRKALKLILEEFEHGFDRDLVRRAGHRDRRHLPSGFGVLPPARD